MSRPRFHVPGAAPGARLVFPEHVAHHAREVLRLRAGAEISVFDGRGAEFLGTLERCDRKLVQAHLGGALECRSESPLWLVLALSVLRGDRMELVIQKAVELGVAEIHPIVTARTDTAARPALDGTRQERWDKVASGAAEQCGRAVVPVVAATCRLEHFLALPFDGVRLVLNEAGGAPLRSLPRASAAQVLVGPPGSFEPVELERAAASGFQPVSLGPRILRTETAAIASIAALQALWSDLG